VYAHTDLGDFYRGTLSLRQIKVRIAAMPLDAPLIQMLEVRESRVREQVEYDSAMAPFEKR
jgi:hypothetical protein